MQNLYEDLVAVLSKDDRLVADGQVMKNKVVELALRLDVDLLRFVRTDERLRQHFFVDVDGVAIFDKVKFQQFISNKAFLPDSYTAYKNKIGLMDGDAYLVERQDVVLAWPYKDCVLEGGQDREDAQRQEVFWNETLAPDQIDRLLTPKVLVGANRYTKDGVAKATALSRDDNLIVKGNNLLALHTLMPLYEGQVQLVCIDPPYNTETDTFNYNDRFNHSTWLTFMKSRLQAARRMLHANGVMFLFCDDSEHAYLRVLCDGIFGRECFITTVVWKHSDNSNNDAKKFSTDHNYILVYARNPKWESIKAERGDENASHFSNPDNDPRGPWFDGNPVNSPNPRENLCYDIISPNGNIIKHPANGWRWSPVTLKEKIATGEIYFNETQTGIKRITYLWEMKALPPSTLWDVVDDNGWYDLDETGHTRQAKSEQKKLFPSLPTSSLFKTPKPERVIQKILSVATREGDLVVDFFAGSGTTAAVAHKMKRRFIGVEQMDYINTFTVPRLQQVIAGEQGGISKDVEWRGGGSFVYAELAQANATFMQRIQDCANDEDLSQVWLDMKERAFLSYRVEVRAIDPTARDWQALSLDDKKRLLMATLDKNMLYVPLSEMDDETWGISEADKVLNRGFFGA